MERIYRNLKFRNATYLFFAPYIFFPRANWKGGMNYLRSAMVLLSLGSWGGSPTVTVAMGTTYFNILSHVMIIKSSSDHIGKCNSLIKQLLSARVFLFYSCCFAAISRPCSPQSMSKYK